MAANPWCPKCQGTGLQPSESYDGRPKVPCDCDEDKREIARLRAEVEAQKQAAVELMTEKDVVIAGLRAEVDRLERLVDERDKLLDADKQNFDAVGAKAERLERERDEARFERDRARKARNTLRAERDGAREAHRKAEAERDAALRAIEVFTARYCVGDTIQRDDYEALRRALAGGEGE